MDKPKNSFNVLITSGRAPLVFDCIEGFQSAGAKVFLCESFDEHLAKSHSNIEKIFSVPNPRQNTKSYINSLISIARDNQIDLIFPCYEESFYLSKHKEKLSEVTQVFVPNFSVMSELHHKYQFINLCEKLGFIAPKSVLINESNIDQVMKQDSVIKPVFSRFASKVLFTQKGQSPSDVLSQNDLKHSVWMSQEKIVGSEFCTYSMALNGNLISHLAYRNLFKAGKGAGIAFETIHQPHAKEWVIKIVKDLNYTGQIAFDFIEDEQGIKAIECNPRATSGFHYLCKQPEVFKNLISSQTSHQKVKLVEQKPGQAYYISKLILFLYALPQIIGKNELKDFKKLMSSGVNILGKYPGNNILGRQMGSLFALLKISFKNKISLLEASTIDIEWNGEGA